MSDLLIQTLSPILVKAAFILITALIGGLLAIGIAYLKSKKDALVKKIGIDSYNHIYEVSSKVFNIVEQQFSSLTNVTKVKQDEFENWLLERVPGLTQEDIVHFREAVWADAEKRLKESQLLEKAK